MKILFVFRLLFTLIIWSASYLQAGESVPDNFELRAGGYFLTDLEANMVFSTQAGPTAGVDLQKLFDIEETSQALIIGGYYRFTPKHSVSVTWFNLNHRKTGDKDLSFIWEDVEINATVSLDTLFNIERYQAQYFYSFYHNDEVELSLGIGLHIAKIDIGYSGVYTSALTTQSGTLTDTDSNSEYSEVAAPLPVVGFKLNYNITPVLKVGLAFDYFYMAFEDLEGSLTDTMLTVDYRVVDNFGLGVGMNATNIRLVDDISENVQLTVQHELLAFILYGTLNF